MALPGVVVTRAEGEYNGLAPDSCGLLFRYNLKLAGPTLLAVHLSISGEDMRAATTLLLVDNDTGTSETLRSLHRHASVLLPNTKGYCLLAVAEQAGSSSGCGEGAYCLTLTSDTALGGWQDTAVSRNEARSAVYTANAGCVVARFMLTAVLATQVCVLTTTVPASTFKVRWMDVCTPVSLSGSYQPRCLRQLLTCLSSVALLPWFSLLFRS